MTPLHAILFVAVIAIAVIVGQFFMDRRTIRKWGERSYQHGYEDGQAAPRAPYVGRHQGISQPEDWTAADLAELASGVAIDASGNYPPMRYPIPQPLPVISYAPDPLPKRKPAAIEMAETMRPLFEELYGKDASDPDHA